MEFCVAQKLHLSTHASSLTCLGYKRIQMVNNFAGRNCYDGKNKKKKFENGNKKEKREY
jgi:hypothetical protein